jgi:hypothetical protein
MAEYGPWAVPLPPATRDYLADLLDLGDFVPATARPVSVTAGIPAPPPDAATRLAAAAGQAGLLAIKLDERPYPLWVRAGTDDAAAALASLSLPAGGVKIPYAPRRILEIGAGAAYRSVALALAHPDADILTTEPDPAFQRAALLNTLPYSNIGCAFLVLSTDTARYGFTGRRGEAGRPALARDDNGPIAATQLKNFLFGRGWNALDTVIITPDAASDHLLRAPWPRSVRLLAVETGGAPLHEATAPCFPDDKFLTVIEGAYVLLHRREPESEVVPPKPVPVFNPEGPARRMCLTHVGPDGFFAIGASGFRLHANASGAPAATLTVQQESRGFTELRLALRSGHAAARPIRFSVRILAGGRELGAASAVLRGGEGRAVEAPLEPYNGPCEAIFTTEMAEFGDSNASAWAEFLGAAFV